MTDASKEKQGILPHKKKEGYVLPEKKICSRCQIEKPKKEFKVRWEKSATPPFPYLNNICIPCTNDVRKEKYHGIREGCPIIRLKA